MNAWTSICRVDDIPVLGSRRVARPVGVAVAVFRTSGDEIFALLDRCPHKGGPLSQGIVFGNSVACPLHNWTFGLDDGCARSPDKGCVPRFACKVEPLVHKRPKLAGCSGSPRTPVIWSPADSMITPQPTPQYGQVDRVSRLAPSCAGRGWG